MNPAADRAPRSPHAVLDLESRRRKARKIAAMLATERSVRGLRVLDVGTGTGGIAASLAEEVGEHGEMHSVDVVDIRIESDGYEFHLVDGATLPFADDTFDVVISNHCIEHVGGPAEQQHHVSELGRVLRGGGIGYLAVPNRWGPTEPHFRLPGLSWLPTGGLQDRYVRLARRGERYDCRLLSRRELRSMLATAGLDAREQTIAAMHVMAEVEEPSRVLRAALLAPDPLLRVGLVSVPTLVFMFRHAVAPA